ncbi:MAG TPA: autotransporter outer membrane beta-barrel domain-containing protein, partial [Candidatus Kapabacteria bacterium]|nr:autotransporter outer membrane beta-barrel domain-containing protein [Candidatus Kapabacteria bacterium]
IAGFAFGNSDTTLEYSEAQNQTDNDTDHYIVYASWYRDNFAVDYIVGYAKGEFDTQRKILDSNAVGNTDNELSYLNIAGSYDFVSGGLTYGPFASYDYLDGTIDNFEETNGGGWEAAFDDQDVKSQIYAVGGHASYAMSYGWGVLVPHARAEWRNELEDERDLIVGRFVQDPVSSFAITPDEPDGDWYQVSAGVSAQFAHGIAAFLDYEEVLEYEDTDLSIVTLGARWEM